MKDFNFVIKLPDGSDILANTDMIEEDIIRLRMGLETIEQKRMEREYIAISILCFELRLQRT